MIETGNEFCFVYSTFPDTESALAGAASLRARTRMRMTTDTRPLGQRARIPSGWMSAAGPGVPPTWLATSSVPLMLI
jgi:hypothetical protein